MVNRVQWHFEAYRLGYSSNIAQGYRDYSTDKILNTEETYALCFQMLAIAGGYEPDTLKWKVAQKYVYFAE